MINLILSLLIICAFSQSALAWGDDHIDPAINDKIPTMTWCTRNMNALSMYKQPYTIVLVNPGAEIETGVNWITEKRIIEFRWDTVNEADPTHNHGCRANIIDLK